MMRVHSPILVLMAACRGPKPPKPIVKSPHVHVVPYDGQSTLSAYETHAWDPLGFDVSLRGNDKKECPRKWYETHDIDCQITILVTRNPRLIELAGTAALSDRTARTVEIDTSVVGDALKIAVAHEFGHILLDTPKHTQGGIMGGSTWWMKPVDYQLACSTIGVCL